MTNTDCQGRLGRSSKCFEESEGQEQSASLGGESQYLRQTKEVRSEGSWVWFLNRGLKRETDSLIVAAQNQSVRTNLVKARIDKSQKDMLCKLCKKADESIDHLVSLVRDQNNGWWSVKTNQK